MRNTSRSLVMMLMLGVAAASGCATSERGLTARDYWPSGARWKQAAKNAVKSPGTWIPLIGVGVVSIDHWDQHISEWAVENTPVFGSTENASDASDYLRTSTTVAMVGTALAVPNADGPWERKPERLILEVGAVQLNNIATSILKSVTDRERPDGADDQSFPSGHASQASVHATLACRNVDQIPGLSKGWRTTFKTSFRVLAAGTAWARVEAGKHYPSDVLFGSALGNFVAVFVYDAFLPADTTTRVDLTLSRKEVSFTLAFSF